MKCQFCNANMRPKVTESGIKFCPKCECIVGGKGLKKNDTPVPPNFICTKCGDKAVLATIIDCVPLSCASCKGLGTLKPLLTTVPVPPLGGTGTVERDNPWTQTNEMYRQHFVDQPKDKHGKYQPHLICSSLTRAIARVREYGVRKYHGEDGWKQQIAIDYLDAIGRHYDECRNNPISRDTESGLLHIAQIATNAMFILQMLSEQGVDLDVMNNPPEVK